MSMENAALLKAIIENAIDGIITINDRGIVESINPSACNLFGYTPDEVIGRNVSTLMPPPDRERHDGFPAKDRPEPRPERDALRYSESPHRNFHPRKARLSHRTSVFEP